MERSQIEYIVRGKQYIVNPIDEIKSATDAYIIGYLAMDGSYHYSKKTHFARMGLSSSEKYIINGVIDEYMPSMIASDRSDREISITNSCGKTYHYNNREHWEIGFPIRFTESLGKFGIAKPKNERTLVGIPKKYMSAYILGVIDADGYISVVNRKDCRTPRLNIIITSSAFKILQLIQREIDANLGISTTLLARKNANCSNLSIWNTKSAIKFCQWIYSDLPKFYNHKKHNIFKSYMSCVCSGELLESESQSAAKPS